jgi:hypothetical protein
VSQRKNNKFQNYQEREKALDHLFSGGLLMIVEPYRVEAIDAVFSG